MIIERKEEMQEKYCNILTVQDIFLLLDFIFSCFLFRTLILILTRKDGGGAFQHK